MKSVVWKGSDYLSAEETVGCLLDSLGVIGKNKYGNAIITKDVIIEVKIKRNRKNKKYESTKIY